jgi:hypothetical protein
MTDSCKADTCRRTFENLHVGKFGRYVGFLSGTCSFLSLARRADNAAQRVDRNAGVDDAGGGLNLRRPNSQVIVYVPIGLVNRRTACS